ncbi:MAG: hypothetical protein A2402_01765 [Candidatus Staskawiczbacteria bacterium RIFOXYC1_FULL_37_43]|nr:MAG: hypothetical protein A2891_02115 [Candidatus Staskawiczbacteria bacterium RIFCSPLOWO2_01_FULL_37_19]OGZ77941.1 MAG: hypothetical protein A2280_02615 [Candidatus Staskawiczbacteria bacterium RIFOXYA12_FULL_37_10]OGZ80449.1 MAG: hypothetical protein A2353_02895 [Candidatus Staskawiczbacteria bacterium RIFOXYB1_FULL_38_37]OGZ82251.1 MAG: hypothetical protein A2402_01765 [Candidatus Staskawiczbacteria bacterium RIFOXYC1_FULL_37_43]OGZ91596.1 MAG: hypothetical protein A2510_03230 [Candidatus
MMALNNCDFSPRCCPIVSLMQAPSLQTFGLKVQPSGIHILKKLGKISIAKKDKIINGDKIIFLSINI